MILSQLQAAPADDTGKWMAVFVGLLAGFWLVRQIWISFFPNKAHMDEYVTRLELESAVLGIKQELKKDIDQVKEEIDRVSESLSGQIKERFETHKEQLTGMKEQFKDLALYTRTTAHQNKDAQQTMMLKMERILITMDVIQKIMTGSAGVRKYPIPDLPSSSASIDLEQDSQ